MAVSCCQLRVLSFNVWGLPYIDSVKIRERFVFIAEELKSYDVVGLQEVWRRADFDFLVRQLEHILPYHHYFHSGFVGSGLCVFSRHPIMAAYTHSFSICGSIFRLGELISGKGIMMCRILTPSGPLSFYTTHLDPHQRDSQSFEIYKFVEQTRGGDPVIMTGDYNTKPKHAAYEFLVASLSLCDVFSDDPVDTCDVATNIYKAPSAPKRIDFVFYSDKAATSLALTQKNRSLALTGTIPGKDFPFSDHEGVEATFQVEPKLITITFEPRKCMDDSKVHQFLRIADNIRAKQTQVKSTPKRAITQWIVLAGLTLAFIFFVDFVLYPLLAPHSLGWVLLMVVAGVSALGVFLVVVSVVNNTSTRAYEANLNEIRTLLKFNSIMNVMPEAKLALKKSS